jgi:hypothetical protein
MNHIKFTFKLTECNGWPKIRVLVDNDLYEDRQFTSELEEITVPIEVLDGDHIISIERYGKIVNNTMVDQQGNILKDQLVELLDIYVDGIKLPEWFTYLGTYVFNNTTYPQAKIWGVNGVWDWPFATPIITWVLDKKTENDEKYNPPTKSTRVKWQEMIKKYQEFGKILKETDD